ncbi:hypothetical protein K4F52_005283 [Lecanicillium sp. MT-2017a]|nr:hypothetical protein K4F52_005283 [Lecanicillium sp. MT-2017a]
MAVGIELRPVNSDSTPAEIVATTDHDVAVIEADEFSQLSLWQAIKKWSRVFLFSLGMSSAILMYGYDYVIVGNASAMPAFQRDFGTQYEGKWILPSLWLGLWTFISPGGGMVGSLIAGYFQDILGRKASFAVGSFLGAVGVAICFVSNLPGGINARRAVFLAGKGFQGGAIGMVQTTCQTYMSEILPPKLRGPLLAFFPIFTLLGQLVGSAVIYACLDLDNGYIICFATQWPFSAVPMIMAFVVPESPTYLIRKDKHAKARRAQKRLDAAGIDTARTLATIYKNIEHERSQTDATYSACFHRVHLRRTLIVMFVNVLPQAFGITLLSQASYFGQVVGMPSSLSVLVLILGIVFGLLANVASMWVVARVGHRLLTLVGLGINAVLWTALGIAGIWSGPVVVWYCVVSLILVIMSAGLSVWPASYAIGSETSALHLRAKVQGIGWFISSAVSAIFGFILPYIYNPDKGNLRAKVAFIYGAICLLCVVVTYYYVPEMKGRTPAEIDRMFDLKLSALEFKDWDGSESPATDKMTRSESKPGVVHAEE